MAGPDILGERQSGQDVRTQNGNLSQPPLKNLLLLFFFFFGCEFNVHLFVWFVMVVRLE